MPMPAADATARLEPAPAFARLREETAAIADLHIQDKHKDETGAETIEIILGVLAAVVLAALVWAGINTFATNKVGELG